MSISPSPEGRGEQVAATVAYQFLGPVKRAAGYCAAECDFDVNGVCRRCECLDPARFVVLEYPTEEQDKDRQLVERLQAAGIEVRRV